MKNSKNHKKGRYITGFDSEDPYSALKDYMENKGWKFKDQMGSGFIFEKDDELITIETRQYSRNYYIWDVPTSISERDFTN
ncbi:hypothetical protein [Bacillus coahuilensis]|uniref:hypothetical protein n=1 Tax=Bacillus coahuilensis TaxID=408580 RepID=UPI000B0FB414|nr:hypothetical protein [Bacillus coahuilensis]